MKISQAMTTTPITGTPDMMVNEAVFIMSRNGVGSLLVVDDKKLVGIMTERDVLNKIVLKSADPKKTKLSDVMSPTPITIDKDADLEEAANKLTKYNIKKLPVVEDGELIGILTDTDIVSHQPSIVRSLTRTIKNKERKKAKKKMKPLIYSNILLIGLLIGAMVVFSSILSPLVSNNLIDRRTVTTIYGFTAFLVILASLTGILVYVNLLKRK